MRVLIADRNATLLESISRAFAHQFSIHTASTRKRCDALLRQSEFDLAIVCEKLADGPGLQLLGQITRSSPQMLRIFAAKGSRLQLLKGSLGLFGLFRTLSYPIDAKKLLSALTLARAALEIDAPTRKIGHVVIEETQGNAIPPASADSVFRHGMPVTTMSVRRVRPSELSRALQPSQVARQVSGSRNVARQTTQPERPTQRSALSQPAVPRSATPPRSPLQSEAFQRALARREAAGRSASSQIDSRSSRRGRPDVTRKRATVFLGATIVVVLLVTTLTFSLFYASAARSSNAQATRTAVDGFSAPHFYIERHDISEPPRNSTPGRPTPSVNPTRSGAQPAAPDPQMVAGSTPIADPSTFGSEASEPIYSN
jgi:ActR/RegA family two-component response regulator